MTDLEIQREISRLANSEAATLHICLSTLSHAVQVAREDVPAEWRVSVLQAMVSTTTALLERAILDARQMNALCAASLVEAEAETLNRAAVTLH